MADYTRDDISKWTEQQKDDYLAGKGAPGEESLAEKIKKGASKVAAGIEQAGQTPPVTSAIVRPEQAPRRPFGDYPPEIGETFLERAAVGAGQATDSVLQGLRNKAEAVGSWAQNDQNAKRTIDAINARKAQKQRYDDFLLQDPAAILGSLVPNVAGGALTVPRLGAQMGTQFALGAAPSPENPIQGPLSEAAGSALKGSIDAGTTWAGGKLFNAAGKAVNAPLGRYTPEGDSAMAYNRAAQELGMESPPIGHLSPNSTAGELYRLNPDYPDYVRRQADALRASMSKTEQIPGVAQGSTETRNLPFGQWQDDLTGAVREQYRRGAGLYDAVDQIVMSQGLGNIQPQRFYNQLAHIHAQHTPPGQRPDHNQLFANMVDYNPGAFDWLTNMGAGASPRTIARTIQDGVLPSNYHEMRIAVNKAYNRLAREAELPNAPANTRILRDEARQLRIALDADANAWAAQNAGNAEAMRAYRHATDYYANNLAPAILDNPLGRKLVSTRRPFTSGQQVLNATTGNAGTEAVDLLRPTMSAGRPANTADVLRGPQHYYMDPVVGALRTGVLPGGGGGANLAESAARAAIPSSRGRVFLNAPLSTIGTLMSGLPSANSELAKRLYFARTPEGLAARAGLGAAQVPEERLQTNLGALLGQRRPGQP